MTERLVEAVKALRIADKKPPRSEEEADAFLFSHRPRKKKKNSLKEVRDRLESTFLKPDIDFSPQWLNKLQQRWDYSPDYTELFQMAPTQTRTVTRFTREGLQGRVTGYKEVTVPSNSATAKNSTSLLRKPANRADFVRGAAGFFPFVPGGLDSVQAVADLEDQALQASERAHGTKPATLDRIIAFGTEGGLLEVAPGFSRGIDFSREEKKVDTETADAIEEVLKEQPQASAIDVDVEEELSENIEDGKSKPDRAAGGESDDSDDLNEDIDALLPVEFPALEPHRPLAASRAKRGGREWAHMVDVNRGISNFRDLVPDMAREWPFELDTFQKEAVYHLENGDSVFVAAHTSAGKTVVAEYAIALAAKHMTKAIYTSPIKALSNQKFRDFRIEFEDVGILTGDVQIRPEASCLIMTTEILRSMLYRGADLIRDVEYVIFDEVHYVNDLERGVVWEEVIIMLPEHVTLILLSATVPNTYEFASWVGRTKKKDIYVISTPKRPVPLEHYLWANKAMHKIVNAEKRFLEQGWKDANDALSGKDKIKATAGAPVGNNNQPTRGMPNGRASGRGQRGGQQQNSQQRGGSQQRGRGQQQPSRGNIARTGRGGGRTTAAQDKNVWVHLVQHLRKTDLLPACIFVFSKKRCEENADALSNLDFMTANEKSQTHMIIERSIARLRPEDRILPQIRRLRELLSRGIAVHHGGMLPIVKEVVEILFAKTLVKVLFATETFAMGLNLPTRTVVFSGFRKHDGRSFRDLLPGEYTQMAGRAGRRGLDPVGSVIIVTSGQDEAPPAARLRQMILGEPTKLRSQFRLTYNMILNLLRVEALKIEEMIKRSFSENTTQALLPEHEKQVKLSEADLLKIKREPCAICDVDLEQCHEAAMAFEATTTDLHLGLLASPAGRRVFAPKQLVVFRKDGVRMAGILLNDGVTKGPLPTIEVLSIGSTSPTRQPSDLLPYVDGTRPLFSPLHNPHTTLQKIPLRDLESVTTTAACIHGGPVWHLRIRSSAAARQAERELAALCQTWSLPQWAEYDWRARTKDVFLRDTLDLRQRHRDAINGAQCLACPAFARHFGACHDEWLIKEHILQLRQLMSDQNLQLLPDYEQRLLVLQDLGFVDGGARVQLKGKVACEIHSADELVLTELILDNALAAFDPAELVALLSAFVFQEKTDVEPALTPRLQAGKDAIIAIAARVNAVQTERQVILATGGGDDGNDFVSRPRFGLVEVVYEWARGMTFHRITDLTDVLEGTIVRVITRLDETCREVKNAARIVGDPRLFAEVQAAQELIRRDITAVASLYM